MTDAPTYRIATIPGDGVGPEVVAAARTIFDVAADRFGFAVEWSELHVGGAAIDAHGVAIRDEDENVYSLRRELPQTGELLSAYLGSSSSTI